MKKITITASDGFRLSALLGISDENSQQAIIISSATAIKKEYYMEFAHFLMKKGYNVLLYDNRGIGESTTEDPKNAEIYLHQWGTLDMNAVLNFMVFENGFIDNIWIGHSIGGQLVGFIENTQYLRKIIAVNSGIGYWLYFSYPMKWVIGTLWYIIGPIALKRYGYGKMTKIGWSVDLPKKIYSELREWCVSKKFFTDFLIKTFNKPYFDAFDVPFTSIYTDDDYMVNDRNAQLLQQFFPHSTFKFNKIEVKKHTHHKVGHVGIFKKKFEHTLWHFIIESIERQPIFSLRNEVKFKETKKHQ